MGKKRKRRTFTDEYKAEVVQLVHASDKSLAQIERDLDLSISAIRHWVAKAKTKTKPQASEVDYESENKALRKQIKVLEMEREILKKTTAFFVKENS